MLARFYGQFVGNLNILGLSLSTQVVSNQSTDLTLNVGEEISVKFLPDWQSKCQRTNTYFKCVP